VAAHNIVFGPNSAARPGSAFEVLADQPLDELASPHATAYASLCADRPGDGFFALISDPAFPPRFELIEKLASMQLNNVLTPVAWGPVNLPKLPPNSFATVFERPAGARVVNALTDTMKPLSADQALRKMLPVMVTTLRAFADARITHRAIRPTNLFFHGADRQILFGDAVSAPPGAGQPLTYEPIEGGMAVPHCRGTGTSADDLYALGVTLVFLMAGYDPTVARDPQDLLRSKIDRGSFTAIVSATRLPPEAIEIVRGLLADDARERWTIEDVENWLKGQRLKPRQQNPSGLTATRPFDFAGRASYTARAVAHAFSSDPSAAARAIRSPEFEIWLQRSLADEKRSVAVNSARAESETSRSNLAQDLRLTARTCMALDPAAPVRYGDFATTIDSLGYALVAAFNGRGNLQTLGEILTARLLQIWVSYQSGLRPDLLALTTAKPFETLRRFAEDPRSGFGLERILYELNPRLHCQSPLLKGEHVANVANLLGALERAAADGHLAEGIIDRHVAAFVATHSRHIGRECFDLLGGSPRQRVLGTLGIIGHLQNDYGPVTVPALGKLIAPQAAGLADMFHSRQRRTLLKEEIVKLTAKGALGDLYWLFSVSNEQTRDTQGFEAAQREYLAIERALAGLRRGELTRPARVVEMAGGGSFVAASFAAGLLALFAVFRLW
jgi:eukaryotic-like serine/threonine-protein kinase